MKMIFNFNIDKLKIKKEMEVENPFRFSEDVLTILLSMSEQNTVFFKVDQKYTILYGYCEECQKE